MRTIMKIFRSHERLVRRVLQIAIPTCVWMGVGIWAYTNHVQPLFAVMFVASHFAALAVVAYAACRFLAWVYGIPWPARLTLSGWRGEPQAPFRRPPMPEPQPVPELTQ